LAINNLSVPASRHCVDRQPASLLLPLKRYKVPDVQPEKLSKAGIDESIVIFHNGRLEMGIRTRGYKMQGHQEGIWDGKACNMQQIGDRDKARDRFKVDNAMKRMAAGPRAIPTLNKHKMVLKARRPESETMLRDPTFREFFGVGI
jgi:hypothetical protein